MTMRYVFSRLAEVIRRETPPRAPTLVSKLAAAEALDALHFTAEKSAAALDFHKGDIQFANNLNIFHARGGFRDSAEKQ